MRKQTKLVAVLSAAALLRYGCFHDFFSQLVGRKSDAGVWHYYDSMMRW